MDSWNYRLGKNHKGKLLHRSKDLGKTHQDRGKLGKNLAANNHLDKFVSRSWLLLVLEQRMAKWRCCKQPCQGCKYPTSARWPCCFAWVIVMKYPVGYRCWLLRDTNISILERPYQIRNKDPDRIRLKWVLELKLESNSYNHMDQLNHQDSYLLDRLLLSCCSCSQPNSAVSHPGTDPQCKQFHWVYSCSLSNSAVSRPDTCPLGT